MSWNAWLVVDDETVPEWNYTHNCNAMMTVVIEEETGEAVEPYWVASLGGAWFDHLNGKSGEEGAKLLGLIVEGMEADPNRFRAMNPENGWGSYDRVLVVLRQMRVASVSHPDGVWGTSG